MDEIYKILNNIDEIESKLGYHFADRNLLTLAFTHCSYVNESRTTTQHNERLEFLGDSILGFMISEYLYRSLPDVPEGELSTLRARLVEASSCIAYIQKLQVERYLLLSKGERMNGGRGRDTILSDLFEAILGAIFLDGGFDATKRFFFNKFKEDIDAILGEPFKNPKAALQDLCQKKFQHAPRYKVLSEKGPDHEKIFKMVVLVEEIELGHGEGTSKKDAQNAAAKNALMKLDESNP